MAGYCSEERAKSIEYRLSLAPSRYFGYTWWANNAQSITLFLSEMWRVAKISPEPAYYFIANFYQTEIHEYLHALGYVWKTKGYSSNKIGHFDWFVKKASIELIECWKEQGRILDIAYAWEDLG